MDINKPRFAIYIAGGLRSRALLAWAKDWFASELSNCIALSVLTNRTTAQQAEYLRAIVEDAGMEFRPLHANMAVQFAESNAIMQKCHQKRYELAASYCCENDNNQSVQKTIKKYHIEPFITAIIDDLIAVFWGKCTKRLRNNETIQRWNFSGSKIIEHFFSLFKKIILFQNFNTL